MTILVLKMDYSMLRNRIKVPVSNENFISKKLGRNFFYPKIRCWTRKWRSFFRKMTGSSSPPLVQIFDCHSFLEGKNIKIFSRILKTKLSVTIDWSNRFGSKFDSFCIKYWGKNCQNLGSIHWWGAVIEPRQHCLLYNDRYWPFLNIKDPPKKGNWVNPIMSQAKSQ